MQKNAENAVVKDFLTTQLFGAKQTQKIDFTDSEKRREFRAIESFFRWTKHKTIKPLTLCALRTICRDTSAATADPARIAAEPCEPTTEGSSDALAIAPAHAAVAPNQSPQPNPSLDPTTKTPRKSIRGAFV